MRRWRRGVAGGCIGGEAKCQLKAYQRLWPMKINV
jgi:hypothetical protein